MALMSSYEQNVLLEAEFNGVAPTLPADFYVALYIASLGEYVSGLTTTLGATIVPSTPNNRIYKVTTVGTTALTPSTEPTWPTTDGGRLRMPMAMCGPSRHHPSKRGPSTRHREAGMRDSPLRTPQQTGRSRQIASETRMWPMPLRSHSDQSRQTLDTSRRSFYSMPLHPATYDILPSR